MAERNWEDDALSAIYRRVWPAMWAGHRALARMLAGTGNPITDFAAFEVAYSALTALGPEALAAAGIEMTATDRRTINAEAENLRVIQRKLLGADKGTLTPAKADALMDEIERDLHPALQRAVDRFRRVFIGYNMSQQEAYALQARDAARELRLISKKIFFISINASVEAARVGDAGRGFQQISTDIRALSQSAEAATSDLSSLIGNGSAG